MTYATYLLHVLRTRHSLRLIAFVYYMPYIICVRCACVGLFQTVFFNFSAEAKLLRNNSREVNNYIYRPMWNVLKLFFRRINSIFRMKWFMYGNTDCIHSIIGKETKYSIDKNDMVTSETGSDAAERKLQTRSFRGSRISKDVCCRRHSAFYFMWHEDVFKLILTFFFLHICQILK